MKNRMIVLTIWEHIVFTALMLCISLLIGIFTYDFDIDKELAKLPESCAKEVKNWSISQTSYQEMADIHYGMARVSLKEDLIGLTVVNDKSILLSSFDIEAKIAFAHEIGHACDANHGYPSTKQEFYEIYLQEAEGYGATDTYEFFAEVYKDVVKGHPSSKTPLANEYVMAYVGEEVPEHQTIVSKIKSRIWA